jgi:hypothetical protein
MARHNLPNSELEDDFGAVAVEGPPPQPKAKIRAARTRNLYQFISSPSFKFYYL